MKFLFALVLLLTSATNLCAQDQSEHIFSVITPEIAKAGELFTIKIIVKDPFGIVVTNFDEVGSDVRLSATGTGRFSPSLLVPSEFIDGIATVECSYDTTESFTIIAEESAGVQKKLESPKEIPELREKETLLLSEKDKKKAIKKHYSKGKEYLKQDEYPLAIKEFEYVISLDAEYKKTQKYLIRANEMKVSQDVRAKIKAQKLEQERRERERKENEEKRTRRTSKIEDGRARSKEYTIETEDELSISVWEWDDLDEDVIVRPDGKISFPLVGDIQAQGLTLTELDLELSERLKVYVRDPEVSVMLKVFGGRKVIVLGEVEAPGVYRTTGDNTISEVIALAGGFTDDAVLGSIMVVRGGINQPQAQRVNLSKVIKKGDASRNIAIQPEDVVYVPKKFIANVNYFLDQLTPALEKADLYYKWEEW